MRSAHRRVSRTRPRDFGPADLPACLEVFDSNVPEFFLEHERGDFESFLRALPGPYLVLEDPPSGVVACGGWAMAEGTDTADLCWGMVRRDRHRGGLGRALLEARLASIRASGLARDVALRTSPATRGFFVGHGFTTERVVPDGIAPGIDQCEMRLVLEPDEF